MTERCRQVFVSLKVIAFLIAYGSIRKNIGVTRPLIANSVFDRLWIPSYIHLCKLKSNERIIKISREPRNTLCSKRGSLKIAFL